MKKIIILAFLSVSICGTAQDAKFFTIKGSLKNISLPVDKVLLYYSFNGKQVVDSIPAGTGQYSFTGKISEPMLASLVLKYLPDSDGKPIKRSNARDMANVFLGEANIEVSSVDSFANVSISGSKEHDEYKKINDMLKTYDAPGRALLADYTKAVKDKDDNAMNKAIVKLDDFEADMKDKVFRNYLKNNPKSPIGLYILKRYAGNIFDPELVESLYQALPDEQKKYESAAMLVNMIEKTKNFSVGKMAADFTQNDTLGIPVKLSSFRGKYLLIDFWASWCGPCRQENPNLVKTYQAYKGKGFDILGVSLDQPGGKDKWLKAIHDDKLTWTHVSDLKYGNNEVALQYGIKSIPQNFLIDPQGKIIAKNIRGESLTKKLAELFP
jgi:peroxiredoxin